MSQVPLFSDAGASFLNELADRLKPRIYAPGDLIVQAGEEGDEMFFLSRVGQHPWTSFAQDWP